MSSPRSSFRSTQNLDSIDGFCIVVSTSDRIDYLAVRASLKFASLSLLTYAAFLPDWVLMDIEMKHTNGIVATERIRAAYPQANIVIVTNYDDDCLRERATAAGARGYVLKENLLALRSMLMTDAMSSQAQS